MASIRRTLSPARIDTNGVNSPFSVSSLPSHKFSTTGKNGSSQLPSFLAVIFLQKHSRKGWKRSFSTCFVLFILGFLFGMTPFGHVDTVTDADADIRSRHDFSFNPPHVNVQLADDDAHNLKREEIITIDTVSLVENHNHNNNNNNKISSFDYLPMKQLIIITPTYNRAMQAYFLNRLGQVLRLVQPPLVWIVVEMKSASMETAEVLRKTGVMYRHLVCTKNLTNVKDRGVHQRNVALDHIRLHKLDGIVYFADDDNVYSLELFQSLRQISRFGTWPVAMLAQSKNKAILEGPVCNGSQVIGWHTNEKSKKLRRFHVDMSGFAFNSTILWDPKRWHRPTSNPIRQLDTVKEGFQETSFIEQVVEDESQMEGIMPGCSRILNWHLHLDTRNLVYPKGWLLQNNLDVVLPISNGT